MVSGLRPGRGVGGLDLEDVAKARHGGQRHPVGRTPHVGVSVELVDDRDVAARRGQAHLGQVQVDRTVHAIVRIQRNHADDGVRVAVFGELAGQLTREREQAIRGGGVDADLVELAQCRVLGASGVEQREQA